MPIFFSKHKKFILSLVLILVISCLGIFVFSTGEAKAGFLDLFKDPKEFVIDTASAIIYWVIFHPLSLLLSIAGFLLDWAFGLEHFTDVGVVQEGWRVTRDLVNMFFVLILLVIALATILRLETYGMKALLPKLIAVALLINFSLVFCGVIIDFTQVLAHFFLNPLEDTGVSLSEHIANGLNIMKIYEKGEGKGLDALNVLIGLIGGTAVILIMAFTMATAAFFLIVRVVALWLLIVLAPIAWLLWVLPQTKNLWDQWWDSFLKWAFFAPAYAFFFYLAVITITGKGGEGGFLSGVYSKVPLGQNEGWISAFFSSQEFILQYIFLIILLFGGLMVAQKISVYGAQSTIGWAKGIGKGTVKWGERRIQMATAKPIGGIGEGLSKTGGWMRQKTGLKTIGRLTGQIARGPRAFEEKERAAFGKAEEKYKSWTSENLKAQYKAVDPRSKAAIAKILAERGDLEENKKYGFTEKDIENAVKLAERYGQAKEVLKARPDLAKDVRKQIAKMKGADIEKIQPVALTKEVIDAIEAELGPGGKWGVSQLSKMAENPTLRVKVQQEIINKPDKKLRVDIEEYLKSDAGKVIFEGKSIAAGSREEGGIKIETPISSRGRKISEEELTKAREALKK